MIGYFKNRDRVTLLNQSFWHTRQRSFRRGEICQLIHRPRLAVHEVHISVGRKALVREGGIIPGRALATTLLGGARSRSNHPFLSTVIPDGLVFSRRRGLEGSGANFLGICFCLARGFSDFQAARTAAHNSRAVAAFPVRGLRLNCCFLIFSANSMPRIVTVAVSKRFNPSIGRRRCIIR